MLTGYHFTAYDNWPSIRERGLRIGRIRDDFVDITLKYAGTEFGAWVFCEPPANDKDLLGQLIFTMSQHKAPAAALIRCEYGEELSVRERARELGYILDLSHWGSWGVERKGYSNVEDYHEGKPFDIVLANIPPEQLSLIAAYGIQEIGHDK